MNRKAGRVCVLGAVVFMAGCASGFRHYDGILGFQSSTTTDGLVSASYTDKQKVDWERIRQSMVEGCAKTLGIALERIVVDGIEQSEHDIRVPVSVPQGVTPVGFGGNGVPTHHATADVGQGTDYLVRTVRTMRGTCSGPEQA